MNNVDKLGDIRLFVKIVEHQGLAAAGRELGISPASVTARLFRLEENYGVRLLNRTTRRIGLTEEGRAFYQSCIRIMSDLDEAEEHLVTGRDHLSGALKISATFDLGRQKIAPLLAEFVRQHPKVSAQLHYADSLVNLVSGGYDLAIRYGAPQDGRLIARKLVSNRRLLCASPEYIARYGAPQTPEDLVSHSCLGLLQEGQAQAHWHFNRGGEKSSVVVEPRLASNDGAQLRQWAILGLGICLKSYWDVKVDLKARRLMPVLESYQQDWGAIGEDDSVDLYAVYLSRDYLPARTRAFIDLLVEHFSGIP